MSSTRSRAELEIRAEDIIRVLPKYPSMLLGVLNGVVEFERRLEGRKSHFWKNMLPRLTKED